ncbi:hypothetical protein BGZ61DRAFT_350733 [Ilyonectria robusta]|uniref:uncharacterized protein n=1 Tax=Ilyonectria robusta TaxID=1079257 RepID=UPI001E8DDA20|nr:uncharacterized protein BGZ61DRAFT_350733 [Ilyonectria robusta]KAH8706853.1 hypothetical protein BGZ61DRAFT_350733 [Ilyonectria robusta]
MGAQQSSEQSDAPGTSNATVAKTCYYDLLGIDRQATDDEIKKAYRRKALELHPDRNINNVETATRRFAEVQSAYEVLSDPQERAWYDSHRDAILSGQDGNDPDAQPTTFRNVRLTSAEEIMSLMRRFNSTVPFDDEPTGFFGIARETFEHLALEEEAAAEHDNVDIPEYPSFGSSDDDYELLVKPFYATWAGFSTAKSFSWKDKYRLSDAPDRRVRRLMEKENKKIRDDAIREFNDAVNFLVGFVRKRDPRYLPNSQSDAERQASMRNAAAAQAARSRAANQERMASYEVPEWAQSKSDGSLGDEHFSQSEEESEVEILECVVCNKSFKSEKQLEAHLRSKKHIKAVQQLRRQMKREGADLQLDEVEPKPSAAATPSPLSNNERIDEEEVSVNPESSIPTNTTSDEPSSAESAEVSDGDDYAPRIVVEERLASGISKPDNGDTASNLDTELSAATQNMVVDEPVQVKKVGKAKAKREKKAAAAAAQSEQDEIHRCSVCGETFTSKTKLFNHIRENGHAAPVARPGAGGKKKKR